MIKVDFYMDDWCEISKAIIFKNNNPNNPPVETPQEARELIKNEKILYFCCKHVQGNLITSKITEYLIDDDIGK
ncbi:hypothetical protein EVU96_09045 [Bacillus infantis]|uniref:hypothetical protein n=1 Tax=Bacillus infantis TaxID=324767 RepID=UPI00101DBFA7|nr:hypothetical protein [Bacillus infantis]RYI30551.1 hypothetical protein EVU96_09045 [Bacillus infantis]